MYCVSLLLEHIVIRIETRSNNPYTNSLYKCYVQGRDYVITRHHFRSKKANQ